MAARHYGICKIELAVEFKRARLDRKGREVVLASAVLSIIRTLTPSLVSQSARARPVGPAPMIRTSLRM
jgi:hypothetical protein